jgi:hypothetical protein
MTPAIRGPSLALKWIGGMLTLRAGDDEDAEPVEGIKISLKDYIHRFSFVDGPCRSCLPSGIGFRRSRTGGFSGGKKKGVV